MDKQMYRWKEGWTFGWVGGWMNKGWMNVTAYMA